MRLDFLEIEQFRGVRGLRLNRLGDVNLLLGNNDAGKTTVLEAVKMFEAPDNIDVIIRNSKMRTPNTRLVARDNYTALDCLLSLFPFYQGHKQIYLCAGIDGELHEFAITGDLLYLMRPVSEDELRYVASPGRRRDMLLTEQEVPTFQGTLYSPSGITPFTIDNLYRTRIPSSRLFLPVVYMAPGEHLSGRSNSSVYKTSKRQEDEIVDLLRLIDPDIEGFKLQPNDATGSYNQTIEHRRFGNVPLYTYGDGMKKILSLAANILDAKGGILLIDEIETSLQASNLKEVFCWLLYACRKFHVQLFVTTHSLESISALASCAVEDQGSELACYRLEEDNGQTFGNRFSERDLDAMVNGRGFDVR